MQSMTQKSEWNAAQSISRLPPEVLVQIFTLTRVTDIWNWDWLILTSVCKHWRNVALDSPSLWADISGIYSISKLKTFLGRSEDADIKVFLSGTLYTEFISSFLETLHPYMKRVSNLSISTKGDLVEWHKIQALFRNMGSHPRLKCLELCVLNASSWSLPSLRFDEDVASSLNVHLHKLILEGISPPWNHQIFQGLCELRLKSIRDHSPTLSEIIKILESCPNLRILHLCNAGLRSSPKISLPLIHLDRLEDICLSEIDFYVCTELLCTIIIPLEAKCSIVCNNYPFAHPRPLFPEFLARRNHDKELCIRSSDNMVTFIHCPKQQNRNVTELTQTFITLEWEDSADLEQRILEVFSSFPTIMKESSETAVSFISLIRGQEYAMKKDVWSCLFDSLPMLKILKVESRSGTMTDMISAIIEPVHVNVPYSFRCPELEEMSVEYATFYTFSKQKSFENFMEHLKDRADHGNRLKKLELLGCFGISKKRMEEIRKRKIVDEVLFESSTESDDDDSEYLTLYSFLAKCTCRIFRHHHW